MTESQGGEKEPWRGLCPLLAITFAVAVSPILTSHVEGARPGLNATAWGSRPGLGPVRAEWVAAELIPHQMEKRKGAHLAALQGLYDTKAGCAGSQIESQQEQ